MHYIRRGGEKLADEIRTSARMFRWGAHTNLLFTSSTSQTTLVYASTAPASTWDGHHAKAHGSDPRSARTALRVPYISERQTTAPTAQYYNASHFRYE